MANRAAGLTRIALPLVDGRGAGLGNEMIVWAKAFIAGKLLGLRVMPPAWGLNQRGYRHYFGTVRADWLVHRALRTSLPFFRFDDAQRIHFGGELQPALLAFAAEHRLQERGSLVLGVHGMGGGFGELSAARDFIRAQLLATRGTLANLFDLDQRAGTDRLRIGLHIRRGDFGGLRKEDSYRGRFNVQIPLDWYVRVATNLARVLGERASFVVVSDASAEELAPLTRVVRCHLTSHQRNRDVSDMLALGSSDFIVCSISSFSLWGAFLSNARYGWFAPNLTRHGDFGSIWGHEAEQQKEGSKTLSALAAVTDTSSLAARGVAIEENGDIPDELIADLERRALFRWPALDLLQYGLTPLRANGVR